MVVLRSLFEEQIDHELLAPESATASHTASHGEAQSYFREPAGVVFGPDQHLTHLLAVKVASRCRLRCTATVPAAGSTTRGASSRPEPTRSSCNCTSWSPPQSRPAPISKTRWTASSRRLRTPGRSRSQSSSRHSARHCRTWPSDCTRPAPPDSYCSIDSSSRTSTWNPSKPPPHARIDVARTPAVTAPARRAIPEARRRSGRKPRRLYDARHNQGDHVRRPRRAARRTAREGRHRASWPSCATPSIRG